MIFKVITFIFFIRHIDIYHIVYAIHRNMTGFILSNYIIASIIMKVTGWSFADHDDLRIKFFEPGIWNLTGRSAMMRGEYNGCFC